MRLKVFTTACLIVGVVLMLSMPWFVGHRPHRMSPRLERRAYVRQLLAVTTVAVFAWIGAGVGSVLILRQARNEYRELAMQNMKQIIEQSLQARKEDDA